MNSFVATMAPCCAALNQLQRQCACCFLLEKLHCTKAAQAKAKTNSHAMLTTLTAHVQATVRGGAQVAGAGMGIVESVLQALVQHDAPPAPSYSGLEGRGYRNLTSRQHAAAGLAHAVATSPLQAAEPITVGDTQQPTHVVASHKLVHEEEPAKAGTVGELGVASQAENHC